MDELSEEQLVRLAKEEDVMAFAALARRYHERIHNVILGFTRNFSDADDLAQEVFMQAFKNLPRFKQDSSFYTWLYRIAVNLTLNFLKKAQRERKKQKAVFQDIFREKFSSKLDSPAEKHSLRAELRLRLEEALGSLPLLYRAAFLLVEYEQMSHKDAALILKCSENTVSWRLHKARKMLRTKLRPYLERGET